MFENGFSGNLECASQLISDSDFTETESQTQLSTAILTTSSSNRKTRGKRPDRFEDFIAFDGLSSEKKPIEGSRKSLLFDVNINQ